MGGSVCIAIVVKDSYPSMVCRVFVNTPCSVHPGLWRGWQSKPNAGRLRNSHVTGRQANKVTRVSSLQIKCGHAGTRDSPRRVIGTRFKVDQTTLDTFVVTRGVFCSRTRANLEALQVHRLRAFAVYFNPRYM